MTLLSLWLVRVDKPNLAMLKRIDYTHLIAMAVFLGGLEYVLEEEGPRYDWFGDPGIAIAGWLSFVGFVLFIERSFRSNGPIVRLTPFRNPTFAMACVFNLVLGFGLYSSTYLVPVFLGRVRDYTSFDIGTTVVVAGIAQVASVVVASRLSQRVDLRYMIAIGLLLFALSLWLSSFISQDWGFTALLLPQALRGFAIMLCIVPSVTMALGAFAMPELRYASALFNLMRNLGGAIGIAVVNTWLADQTRIHVARLGESLGEAGRQAPDAVAALAARLHSLALDSAQALHLAQGEFARVAARHSLTLAFDEVFRLMAWMFVVALVMVPFCKSPKLTAAPPADAH